MDASAIIMVLCVLTVLAGVFVWLFTRVQEHHRAHYSTLVTVAAKHNLTFTDDPDPNVRLRLDGTINGMQTRILSRLFSEGQTSGPSTQICGLFSTGLPKGNSIIRDAISGELKTERETNDETNQTAEFVRHRDLQRAMALIEDLDWGASTTSARIDDKGFYVTVSTLADNAHIIDQSLNQIQAVKTALTG
jgi:hypothetical protein